MSKLNRLAPGGTGANGDVDNAWRLVNYPHNTISPANTQPHGYIAPDARGSPAAWSAMDAAAELLAQLDTASLVDAHQLPVRADLARDLRLTTTAAALVPADSAALCLVAREVRQ
ncbi:MAG: hypothetical protein KKA73_25525 [Chloroflexi bacterium]|nr:hypothetical protein [Chloroflexota bacterium]